MFFLADFSVIKPDVGLLFWTTVIFLLFWFVIGRFAFRPIADALSKREDDIRDALDEAKKASQEMENLNAENEKMMAATREERSQILREAKETKDKIIKEARDEAKAEAAKIVNSAKMEIESQKQSAMTELKNQVGMMAIEIAEKVVRKELKGNSEHEGLVNTLVDDIKLN